MEVFIKLMIYFLPVLAKHLMVYLPPVLAKQLEDEIGGVLYQYTKAIAMVYSSIIQKSIRFWLKFIHNPSFGFWVFLFNWGFYLLLNIDLFMELQKPLDCPITVLEPPIPDLPDLDLDSTKDIPEPNPDNKGITSRALHGLGLIFSVIVVAGVWIWSIKPPGAEAPGHWIVEQNLIPSEYAGVAAFMIVAIIVALLITAASFVLVTQLPEVEKLTPYECGFEAYEAPRVQFDIKFCVVAILLILFDVEMMYVFPWCISICKLPALGTWSMIDFLLELGFGYIYLSERQALEW